MHLKLVLRAKWAGQHKQSVEILRLLNRLISLEEDRLPRQVFNNRSYTDHPWVSNIMQIFHLLDVSYVFHNKVPIRNFKTFINFANKKLMKEYETNEWIKRVDATPKLEKGFQKKPIVAFTNSTVFILDFNI